jgi:hypothetical protein
MKPHFLLQTGILGFLFVVTSCAPRLQEVQVPPERIFKKGYSLVPLNEKGWFIAGRNPYQLDMGKSGEGPDETVIIHAVLVRLPPFTTSEEFVHLVKEGQAKDTDPKRFKTISYDVTAYPEKGPHCAKSYGVMEDHAAVKRSRLTGYMLLEILTLTCAHPKDNSVGVSVTYSQRYYPETKVSGFLEKASGILSSVEFSDLGEN